MSTLDEMLGEDVSDSQLKGEENDDPSEIKSQDTEQDEKTESIEKVEDKKVQTNVGVIDDRGKKSDNLNKVDFRAKYEEEKGFRTRLLSENKEYKSELNELRALKKEFEDLKIAQQKAKEAESGPDPKEDPIGYLQNTLSSLRKDIENIKQDKTKQTEVNTQNVEVQKLVKALQKSSIAFKENNPSFDDAIRFLSDVRTKELQMYGYDEDRIENIITYDVLQLTQNAIERELNPSELLYSLAKVKGFVSKKELKEGFDKMEKGSKRSKSLSSVGESLSTVPENPSLNELLNASDEDFDKHWDKVMRGR